jgi:alpha-beta hydrolase superfamily lysophospholipase
MPQEAFFFRESRGALYGSYHPPTAAVRPTAVVLCPPYGHEYLQGHRAFRLLADRLAEVGFPALRFDYRGTGDSAGDAEQVDLDLWREDVRAATEMCRARSGRQRVCALGLRLGGSLAALEAGRGGAFDALVLWDPIVSGPDYLAELARVEHDFRQSLPGASARAAGQPGGVLGFPYPRALLDQLGALDLRSARVEGTRAALVIHTRPEQAGPVPSLPLGVARQDSVAVSEPRIWMEDADKALIPQGAIAAAVDWLSKLYA